MTYSLWTLTAQDDQGDVGLIETMLPSIATDRDGVGLLEMTRTDQDNDADLKVVAHRTRSDGPSLIETMLPSTATDQDGVGLL